MVQEIDFQDLAVGDFRPEGDKVTVVGAKIYIKITDNNLNQTNVFNDKFRLFWMRGGTNGALTTNKINNMTIQPDPLHGILSGISMRF